MKTAESIKLNLKELSDFGKVDILDALAAVDHAERSGYERGVREAATIAGQDCFDHAFGNINARTTILSLLNKKEDEK